MLLITLLASSAYLFAVWRLYTDNPRSRNILLIAMAVAFVAHFIEVYQHINGLMHNVSVTSMLTLVALGMTVVGIIRYLHSNDYIIYSVTALIAVICVWLPQIFPTPATIAHGWALKIHIVLSIAAYIALSFAALYAAFLLLQDYRLCRGEKGFNLALSLNDIERNMLSFTRFGQALLTLSLATGILFIKNIATQHVAHKLFFGAASWIIIGGVLLLHYFRGFRGRPAALWLLGGFTCLILAYFGTAFVLQIILQR